jgi:hypothetical protein
MDDSQRVVVGDPRWWSHGRGDSVDRHGKYRVMETEIIPRYYYHYFNGGQYECFTSPTELSENGTKELECEPEKRSWGSREYGFTEK